MRKGEEENSLKSLGFILVDTLNNERRFYFDHDLLSNTFNVVLLRCT